jgi:hypothetical protein
MYLEAVKAMDINKNQRREERVDVALAIRLNGVSGKTRDVSAGGICFDVEADYSVGSEINFVIEMEGFNAGVFVKCKGTIVRTQTLGRKRGVAVSLTETIMETAN